MDTRLFGGRSPDRKAVNNILNVGRAHNSSRIYILVLITPDESQWVLERKTRYSVTPQHKYPKRSKALTQTATNPCPTEGPHYSLTSASLALAQKLVGLLEEDKGLGMKIQSLGLFIFEIPSRLGNSQALDDAMECICSAYVSVLQPICHKSEQDRHQYFQALKSLRQCILDETQALSSNVLAAAVLLSWYEVCYNIQTIGDGDNADILRSSHKILIMDGWPILGAVAT
jgi:hypothetical protein